MALRASMKMTKAQREAQARRRLALRASILAAISSGTCKHADLVCTVEDRAWECSCGMKVTLTVN